jgi:uncharacterized protein
MQTQTIELTGSTPGLRHSLRVLHFGPANGPKATIQAALHADEVPALLVAQALRQRLQQLEADGQLLGPVQLLPWANPLGLGQHLLGHHLGRFDLRDGLNFNRGYAELAAATMAQLQGLLGDDAQTNTRLARQALVEAAAALTADTPAQDLKRRLLQLAVASDVVLDLHCDGEAAMHLYALSPQADWAAELGALLGARAVLLATDSGDSPFDEALSRPWLLLQQALAPRPLPLGCFAATVELRGEADTRHEPGPHRTPTPSWSSCAAAASWPAPRRRCRSHSARPRRWPAANPSPHRQPVSWCSTARPATPWQPAT